MWTLVYLVFMGGELESTVVADFETMYACFEIREQLSFTVGGKEGYYPPGSQAVCVYRDTKPT